MVPLIWMGQQGSDAGLLSPRYLGFIRTLHAGGVAAVLTVAAAVCGRLLPAAYVRGTALWGGVILPSWYACRAGWRVGLLVLSRHSITSFERTGCAATFDISTFCLWRGRSGLWWPPICALLAAALGAYGAAPMVPCRMIGKVIDPAARSLGETVGRCAVFTCRSCRPVGLTALLNTSLGRKCDTAKSCPRYELDHRVTISHYGQPHFNVASASPTRHGRTTTAGRAAVLGGTCTSVWPDGGVGERRLCSRSLPWTKSAGKGRRCKLNRCIRHEKTVLARATRGPDAGAKCWHVSPVG